jgi:hypothetical protein
MAKWYIMTILVLQSFYLSAQDARFNWGVQAGVNLSTTTNETASEFGGKDNKVGFQAGVTIDYNLSKAFFLQSGLSYTEKGTRLHSEAFLIGGPAGRIYGKQTVNQAYLQLPVNIGYKFELSKCTKLFVQAGPYIAYGIGGNATSKYTYEGAAKGVDQEKQSTFSSNGLKSFDYGVGTGIGATFGKIVVSAHYEFGLADIGQDNMKWSWINYEMFYNNTSYYNRNASLTVGYQF